MADKSSSSTSKPTTKPTTSYISSSGQTLTSLPLSARLNRLTSDVYNFLGLYFVSLLSLDSYTAAQRSRFNTRGPGRQPAGSTGTTAAGRSGAGNSGGGLFGGGRLGGDGSGPRGGGGGAGAGSGRRMGTVDDVRGPECGSCG